MKHRCRTRSCALCLLSVMSSPADRSAPVTYPTSSDAARLSVLLATQRRRRRRLELDDRPLAGAGSGRRGPVVALICAGVDHREPSLEGRLLEAVRFHDGPSEPKLGTALAKLIAARPEGSRHCAGVAPTAQILPLIALDGTGNANHSAQLARAVDAAVELRARILLIPLSERRASPVVRRAIARAAERGLVIIAPSGHDGLDQDAFPAQLDAVLSVAEGEPGGLRRPLPGTNLSPRTELVAPSRWLLGDRRGFREIEGPAVAAGVACAIIARAIAADPSLTRGELVRLLSAGPSLIAPARFYRAHRAVTLAARALEARALGAEALLLEDLRFAPPLAVAGARLRLEFEVVNRGRLPLCGRLAFRAPGNPPWAIDIAELAPGAGRRLATELRATAPARVPAFAMATNAGGLIRARPSYVEVEPRSLGGAALWPASARLDYAVLERPERLPCLEISKLRISGSGQLSITVHNSGNTRFERALLRLRSGLGKPRAAEILGLEAGELRTLSLEAPRGARAAPAGPLCLTLHAAQGADLHEHDRLVLERRVAPPG
jgi:hypothetical protein